MHVFVGDLCPVGRSTLSSRPATHHHYAEHTVFPRIKNTDSLTGLPCLIRGSDFGENWPKFIEQKPPMPIWIIQPFDCDRRSWHVKKGRFKSGPSTPRFSKHLHRYAAKAFSWLFMPGRSPSISSSDMLEKLSFFSLQTTEPTRLSKEKSSIWRRTCTFAFEMFVKHGSFCFTERLCRSFSCWSLMQCV